MSADAWVAVCAALCGTGFLLALGSIAHDRSRGLDATLDFLLDSDPDDEPADEVDEDPDPPRAALTPAQVLAMTPGQIAALCRPLDVATSWSIHPALQRRKPRPGRDPFDFFANGGMS